MTKSRIQNSTPDQLARLLSIDDDRRDFWRDDELASVLDHQLSSPLQMDLAGMAEDEAGHLRALADTRGMTLKSFDDLLHHKNPPIELLYITKEYAKTCRMARRCPIPDKVADLLYYASIAAAVVHARKRISTLDDAAMRDGFEWILGQTWVDDRTKDLAREARNLIGNLS